MIRAYFQTSVTAAKLAVFRIVFGLIMLISIIRFWLNGWIEKLYIQPKFFFSFYGFDWIKPIGNYTYLVFIVSGLSSLLIILGYRYRIAIITFFLTFTYIELMDKTTYLNHYYFVSVLSFLLIFLPANATFSLDAYRDLKKSFSRVPSWTVDSIKFLLTIVYLYAGIAKVNSDWLIDAKPLSIWLPAKYDIPFLGDLFQHTFIHYVFSWGGMIYDLVIPFLLWYKPTRLVAFIMVVVFHVLTRIIFPIGMFPYIMIAAAVIFFDENFHQKCLELISKIFKIKTLSRNKQWRLKQTSNKMIIYSLLCVFFISQLLFPWRYLLYPGELFWTEQGYRFSWRVMLMEKAGFAEFKIIESNGNTFYADNHKFLTIFQQKQMATQPDFILEYAKYLESYFTAQGKIIQGIYVDSYVSLNGRGSRSYIDPKCNLLKQEESFKNKPFILPFNETIKGF